MVTKRTKAPLGDLPQLALSTGASVVAMATAFSGLVYLANNWFSFSGGEIGRVILMSVAGLGATVFAMVFANLSRPLLTAVAALIAMITPTGFYHFANMMSLGLAVLAITVAVHAGATRRADNARYARAISDVKTEAKKLKPSVPVRPSLIRSGP